MRFRAPQLNSIIEYEKISGNDTPTVVVKALPCHKEKFMPLYIILKDQETIFTTIKMSFEGLFTQYFKMILKIFSLGIIVIFG